MPFSVKKIIYLRIKVQLYLNCASWEFLTLKYTLNASKFQTKKNYVNQTIIFAFLLSESNQINLTQTKTQQIFAE